MATVMVALPGTDRRLSRDRCFFVGAAHGAGASQTNLVACDPIKNRQTAKAPVTKLQRKLGLDRRQELVVLKRVVDDGSFSAAGRTLGLSPSTVSKVIARLENRVGIALFHRAGRSVTLTTEGTLYFDAAQDVINAMEALDAAVSTKRTAPGVLRVRSMPSFAVAQLAPLIPAFRELHPAVRLEIVLSMEPGNLLDRGIDVAIHVGPLADSSLIAHRFASTRWIICAAPSYLAARGCPDHPEQLLAHECIQFLPGIPARPWFVCRNDALADRLRARNHIQANQSQMLLELAREGAGIVQLTEFQVAADLRQGTLVELFPSHQNQELDPIYAVYAGKRHLSPRIKLFLDFLDNSFPGRPSSWFP